MHFLKKSNQSPPVEAGVLCIHAWKGMPIFFEIGDHGPDLGDKNIKTAPFSNIVCLFKNEASKTAQLGISQGPYFVDHWTPGGTKRPIFHPRTWTFRACARWRVLTTFILVGASNFSPLSLSPQIPSRSHETGLGRGKIGQVVVRKSNVPFEGPPAISPNLALRWRAQMEKWKSGELTEEQRQKAYSTQCSQVVADLSTNWA
jgi:hypothetical protein